jgi:hypothetical protein
MMSKPLPRLALLCFMEQKEGILMSSTYSTPILAVSHAGQVLQLLKELEVDHPVERRTSRGSDSAVAAERADQACLC